MTVEAYAAVYVPTRRERFWRKLGYRYHLGQTPDGADDLPGWFQTNIRLEFSIADRVRLLLTGRLKIVSTVHTDSPNHHIAMSRVDWEMKAPGDHS